MTDLLPCLSCGCNSVSLIGENIDDGANIIRCEACGMIFSGSGWNEETLIKSWNKRADNTILKAKDDRIAELETFIESRGYDVP